MIGIGIVVPLLPDDTRNDISNIQDDFAKYVRSVRDNR